MNALGPLAPKTTKSSKVNGLIRTSLVEGREVSCVQLGEMNRSPLQNYLNEIYLIFNKYLARRGEERRQLLLSLLLFLLLLRI